MDAPLFSNIPALDEDVMKRYFREPLEQVVRKTSVPVMDLMMEPLFAANDNYLDWSILGRYRKCIAIFRNK